MQTVAVIERRHLLWRDPPVWPFLWRGLLPLAGLAVVLIYALGPFAHRTIEARVEQQIGERLRESGFTWVATSVSGQSVRLSGVAPHAADAEGALALARTVTCPTWSGERVCATRVAGDFSAAPPATDTGVPASSTPAAPAAAPVARPSLHACQSALTALLSHEQPAFSPGTAHIEAKSAPLLDKLAQQVRACPGTVLIAAYTDNVGKGIVNIHLSEARATAMRTALIARGVAPTRLRTRGFGAHHPVADNNTEAGRAKNRRIEFHVLGSK